MIISPTKIALAIVMVILLHVMTDSNFTLDFLLFDVLFFAAFYVIILACQALITVAKDKYDYLRDRAEAEADLLAELEDE